ncbi:hypothetical protein WICMUC_004066 [Wickerhamomyces mucosus]|uniref:Mitochondrial peculiar membrane protein 1 n=1 Tax=Wickerhamomyces mucosus TaxID=1378264 RepID=A0A9P8TBN7_9ASCO|nr:hypothetical protein WICMUC_004066 [Wickerhamomyces mucosus]
MQEQIIYRNIKLKANNPIDYYTNPIEIPLYIQQQQRSIKMGIYNNTTQDSQYTEQQVSTAKTTSNSSKLSKLFDPESYNGIHSDISTAFNKFFENTPLSHPFGSSDSWSDSFSKIESFKRDNFYDDLINPSTVKTHYKSFPIPSIRAYDRCIQNEGESVWDEKGWWRCLFPKSRINDEREISKEDVLYDTDNKYGLFFKDYTDFLNWRVKVRELVKAKELEERQLRDKKSQTVQSIYNGSDNYLTDNPQKNQQQQQQIRSSSTSTYLKTLENGDVEEITESKQIYEDGSKKLEKFKKTFPKDGGKPIIENISEGNFQDHYKNKDKGLSHWIWGNDED